MPRNLIIGDIHSEYGKLISALEKASYDPDSDVLYFLGDLERMRLGRCALS